jgi:hypothetical protein
VLFVLSFVLVLVATLLLVLGLIVSDGTGLIYVSIGVSALAALPLVIAVRRSAPAQADAGASGPQPASEPTEPEPEPMLVGAAASTAAIDTPPPPLPAAIAVAATPAAEGDWRTIPEAEPSDDVDADFPIADYDDLTEDDVLALLPMLYSDELDIVEDRERHGQRRSAVLGRLAELRATGTDADRELDPERADDDRIDTFDEDGADRLPISGYDGLTVSEVIAAMGGLSAAELAEIRRHEAGTRRRRTILAAIDRRAAAGEPPSPPVE